MPESSKLESFHPLGALDARAYDRLITDSNVGICVWRLETPGVPASLRLVGCNPAAGGFLSVTPAEVLGKRIHEGFPGSEKMPLPQLFTEVIERGKPKSLGEVPYRDSFGDGMYSIHVYPLPHQQCCVEFTNITARVRAEVQVAERTERLTRALAELWSEMDLARKIQTVLVPRSPRVRGYEVAAQMRPASTVGGDYVDVFEEGGRVWMLIGDVSGRGITAGLTMMMVQTAVRSVITSLSRQGVRPEPSAVLDAVNTALSDNLELIGRDQYMTINALRLEGGTVTHAGLHQDILVHRAATNTLDRFESEGLWLGVFSDASKGLLDQTFVLAEGDTLLLFTDGLTEAKGPQSAGGQRRLEAHFSELAAAGISCEEMVQRLLDRASEASPPDDSTVLVARRREAPGD